MISELSKDGTQFIRTFDLQSIGSIPLNTWKPFDTAIGEDENIFIAGYSKEGYRVIQMNSRLNRIEMEINHDLHQIDQRERLCYVREKHMLIVGHRSICLFDCWNN